jgi:hypothetical protein
LQHNWPEVCTDKLPLDLITMGILIFVALLFGLFTIGMFCDMMCSIRGNTTQVCPLPRGLLCTTRVCVAMVRRASSFETKGLAMG